MIPLYFLRRWEVLKEADLPVREEGLYGKALSPVVSDICLRCKQMTLLPEQQPGGEPPDFIVEIRGNVQPG